MESQQLRLIRPHKFQLTIKLMRENCEQKTPQSCCSQKLLSHIQKLSFLQASLNQQKEQIQEQILPKMEQNIQIYEHQLLNKLIRKGNKKKSQYSSMHEKDQANGQSQINSDDQAQSWNKNIQEVQRCFEGLVYFVAQPDQCWMIDQYYQIIKDQIAAKEQQEDRLRQEQNAQNIAQNNQNGQDQLKQKQEQQQLQEQKETTKTQPNQMKKQEIQSNKCIQILSKKCTCQNELRDHILAEHKKQNKCIENNVCCQSLERLLSKAFKICTYKCSCSKMQQQAQNYQFHEFFPIENLSFAQQKRFSTRNQSKQKMELTQSLKFDSRLNQYHLSLYKSKNEKKIKRSYSKDSSFKKAVLHTEAEPKQDQIVHILFEKDGKIVNEEHVTKYTILRNQFFNTFDIYYDKEKTNKMHTSSVMAIKNRTFYVEPKVKTIKDNKGCKKILKRTKKRGQLRNQNGSNEKVQFKQKEISKSVYKQASKNVEKQNNNDNQDKIPTKKRPNSIVKQEKKIESSPQNQYSNFNLRKIKRILNKERLNEGRLQIFKIYCNEQYKKQNLNIINFKNIR